MDKLLAVIYLFIFHLYIFTYSFKVHRVIVWDKRKNTIKKKTDPPPIKKRKIFFKKGNSSEKIIVNKHACIINNASCKNNLELSIHIRNVINFILRLYL